MAELKKNKNKNVKSDQGLGYVFKLTIICLQIFGLTDFRANVVSHVDKARIYVSYEVFPY